jgi:hypothetical protein
VQLRIGVVACTLLRMDARDQDPFAASTSNAQGSSSSSNGHGGDYRTVNTADIAAQASLRQISNLEKAMAVTSPIVERANPLGMHVVSKQRRKSKAEDTASSAESASNSDPREAIKQQFNVSVVYETIM